MKKLKVLGLAAASACLVSMTSCLNGGSNNYSNTSYALIDFSTKAMRTLAYPLGDYPLYISSIANDGSFKSGDCVVLNYAVDLSSADNSSATATGYYVATGTASTPMETAYLRYAAMDSTVLENELLMTDAGTSLMSSENFKKIVALGQHASLLTDQKNEYSFFFDSQQTPATVEGTERVYTIFMRCQKKTDGKAPTLSGYSEARAVDAAQFYSLTKSMETTAGKEAVYYQLKYPKEFNSDSTQIKTWGVSKVSGFSIKSSTGS